MNTFALLLLLFSNSFGLIFAKCNAIIDNKISSADITTIVNKHNEVRTLIATGQVPGQPKGTNLKRMKWDANLAKEAQNIANTCEFNHVTVTDSRWNAVGQNLFTRYSTEPEGADWNSAVQAWFDEHKQYQYPGGFSLDTGHYTQVIWADTVNVGCGYSQFKIEGDFKYQHLYVCNYGPSGNYAGMLPYETNGSGCENLC